MPVWLSRLFGREGKVSKLYDPERFTRFDFLMIVICIAVIVVLEEEVFDLFGLSIIAGIVIAIALLLYLTRISLWIVAVAACFFLFREAKGIQHSQTLAPWVVLGFFGFVWLSWLIYFDDHLILQQLDAMHEKVNNLHHKIDGLQKKINNIEEKLDESGGEPD